MQAVEKAGETIRNEKTEGKFKTFLANLEKINKIVLRTTESIHIINLDHTLRYDKAVGGHLIMDDSSWVPVSLRKKEQLFRIFEDLE